VYSNKMTARLLSYEIRNTIGNMFTIIFGVFFPILMSILFSNVITAQFPAAERMEVNMSIFLSLLMLIPMATLLIGYAANFSQELENNIPLRLNLFGVNKQMQLMAKLISNLIFMIGAAVVYTVVDMLFIKLSTPVIGAVLFLFVVLILIGSILLVIAHSVALIFGKFGPTYAVTMTLYFALMILCGMMGVQVSQFPPFVQNIANLIPMTYMGRDYIQIWQGHHYNITNFVISFLAFALFALVIYLLSMWKTRRKKSR